MIPSIREIFKVNTVENLDNYRDQFDTELNEKTQQLIDKLEQNILSTDVSSIEIHMAYVESWRVRLVKYHGLASAFVEHAKGSTFLPEKFKEGGDKPIRISENDRDAYRRKTAGGFVAIQTYLEGLIDCVDSRVNLCKKTLGIEVTGGRQGQRYS